MHCEDLKPELSLYIDDMLSLPSRVACEEHLVKCPLCRTELASLMSVKRGLAGLSRPVLPDDLIPGISDALMIECAARLREPQQSLDVRFFEWLKPRLMPYTVGVFASCLLFVTMFAALRTSLIALSDLQRAAKAAEMENYRLLYLNNDRLGPDLNQPIATRGYPSLNPQGPLAALAWTPATGRADEDDMVILTDVFSNGRAAIADVVEPPRNRRALDDFQSALRRGPAFVPAAYDGRPQTMRVVFVMQKVNVNEGEF